MEFRLNLYDRLGAERGVATYPTSFTRVGNLNDLPTLEVQSIHQFSSKLDNDPEVAFQYTTDGLNWLEPRNCRFRLQGIDRDHLDATQLYSYQFIGVGEALRGQTVYGAYGKPVNDEGKIQFKTATAGSIIKTVWDNAVGRGWTGYSYNFTATQDSLGNNWDKTFTAAYDMETSIDGILNGFVQQGLVDFWWQGRTLNMVKLNSAAFTDHTLNPNNPNIFVGTGNHTGIDSGPEKTEHGGLATHIIIIGEKNVRWTFPTGIVLPEGRREVTLRYNGVDDVGSAGILAAPYIAKAQNILKNTTRQFHLTPDTEILPYSDYKEGDWTWVSRDGALERMRIQAISTTTDEHGTQGYAQLGDRVDDLLDKLYKRVQGMSGGVGNVGGGTAPAPAKPRVPSAPSGVVVNTSTFVNTNGVSQSQVDVTWAHDGKGVDGAPIAIREYRLFYRRLGETNWRLIQIVDSGTSTTFAPLETFSSPGVLAQHQFMLTAITEQGISSAYSSVITKTMIKETTPPPKPTNPIVETFLRSITVDWDGMGLSPSDVVMSMPVDFRKVQLFESLNSDMSGQVKVAEFQSQSTWAMGDAPANVTRYYRMNAVDSSDNVSGYTAIFSATPKKLIEDQEMIDLVDNFDQEITDTVALAEGLITYSPSTPTVGALAGKVANSRWIQIVAGKVVGNWYKATDTDTVWTPAPLDASIIPQINIGTGTFGDLDGVRMKARSISVDKLLVSDQQSYLENGNFETGDFLGWTQTSGTWSIVNTGSYSGTYHARARHDAGTHGITNNFPIFMKTGEKVRIKFWSWSEAVTAGTQLGVAIRAVGSGIEDSNTTEVHTSATWAEKEFILTATSTGYKNLYFYTTGTGAGYTRIDEVRMLRMNGGEMIVDGTLKAIKIDTNDLAADTGFIGYLKTSLIVSDVFSGKNFTGGTFNQATFQTTSTALRGVKMTPSGIFAYSSTGALQFSLNATTGRAVVTGRITTGDPGAAGTILLPADESQNGLVSGLFISRDGSVVGTGPTESAGVWLADSVTATAQNLLLRGANNGHVEVMEGHLYLRAGTARIGNFSNWAIGDNTAAGGNYLHNLQISSGYLRIQGASTTSAAANTVIATSPEGVVYRSTSSLRYKADVQDWDADLRALGLRPRSWVDRNPIDPAAPLTRYYGYIAEEVHEIMPEFVSYNEFEEPEAVTYDRMPSPATIAILKNFQARLEAAGL